MRLPPLNALRAFEAAARHEGFIGASNELNVTRGAISRHVKLLEDHLGVALFIGHAQGVRLTPAGAQLGPVLTESFRRISGETARLAADASELRVICPPATSIRWLLPRLSGFQMRHPDIRISLTTEFYAHFGFGALDYDVGFSVTKWPGRPAGMQVAELFPVYLTPACSPAHLERIGPLKDPSDLGRSTLLHETTRRADWTAWLEHFGLSEPDPETGDVFPNLDMATKAALMGVGTVMADLVLCRDELASGALVTPFPDMVCASPMGGVCIITQRDRWNDPRIAALRDWLDEEAGEDRARLATLSAP